jgi:hypothetical protein
MKKIEELALGSKVYLPDIMNLFDGHRKPQAIEEACLGGSQAARVLIILRTLKKEEERFDNMRDLEKKRRDAECGLNKLKNQ